MSKGGKTWMIAKSAGALQSHYKKIYIEKGNPHFWMVINPDNIREWYVLYHDIGYPYEGGEFLMKLVAPSDYPFNPPSFSFMTPTNRFETNAKPCVSMGHYHSDNWSPRTGMYGFAIQIFYSLKMPMTDLGGGIGILTPDKQSDILKHECAAKSISYNISHYPDIIKLFEEERTRIFKNPEIKESNDLPAEDVIVKIEKKYKYIQFKIKKDKLKIKHILDEKPDNMELTLKISNDVLEQYKNEIDKTKKKNNIEHENIKLNEYQLNKKIFKYYKND